MRFENSDEHREDSVGETSETFDISDIMGYEETPNPQALVEQEKETEKTADLSSLIKQEPSSRLEMFAMKYNFSPEEVTPISEYVKNPTLSVDDKVVPYVPWPTSKIGIELKRTDEFDELNGLNFESVINQAIDSEASDIDIKVGDYISFTILGYRERQPQFGVMDKEMVDAIYGIITSHTGGQDFSETHEMDSSYTVQSGKNKGRRFRVNVILSLSNKAITMRTIYEGIPSPEEMNVPQEIIDWTKQSKGLILFNGETGSGKSTLMASLIDKLLREYPYKVSTVENPIEYVFQSPLYKGVVEQREVGRLKDTSSFVSAITSFLRRSPDVIMVGEGRNAVELDAILNATESGHLTLSTMHSSSAPTAINRIRGRFESSQQERVLTTLSSVTLGFVNQVLVHSPDGKKRTPVREVVAFDDEVKRYVNKGDSEGLYDHMFERGITLEHELLRAVNRGLCNEEEALHSSNNRTRMKEMLSERKNASLIIP